MCVCVCGLNPVLSSELHRLLRSRKSGILGPSYQCEIRPVKFRRRLSGSSLPFTDGGAEPLNDRATSLQKGRRQCMCVGQVWPSADTGSLK